MLRTLPRPLVRLRSRSRQGPGGSGGETASSAYRLSAPSSTILCASSRLRGLRSSWALGDRLPLKCHLSFGLLFASGPCIGRGQLVMTGGISRLPLHIAFEGRDRIRELPRGIQGHPQGHGRLLESLIKLRRSREMSDRFVPLPGLTRRLPELKLRRRMIGIDLQFFLELL